MIKKYAAAILTAFFVVGCATVDVTKTAKGFYDPTNPNDVEILKTLPGKPYVELGTITAADFKVTDSAVMYNEIRAKSAALGADAAVLTDEGIVPGPRKWATGVAIKFSDVTTAKTSSKK